MNSKSKRIILVLFLLFGLLFAGSSVFAEDENPIVPLKGHFEGVGADFSGEMTHLGHFVGVFDLGTFTAEWTAANGDTVTNQTVRFDFISCDGSLCTYEQELFITGGTGRFASAEGSATITGQFDLASGWYDGLLDGTISW